jgi:hypothetical protein
MPARNNPAFAGMQSTTQRIFGIHNSTNRGYVMKKFVIETTTCEFEVPEMVLDRMINSFVSDGYEILNDDTNELLFEDPTGNSPRMVFRELAASTNK